MSNMYKFAQTWNPLGGKCPHDCCYCSTKKIMKRNLPYFNKKYSGELRLIYTKSGLKKNLGSGNFWFVCAQMDLFAKDVSTNMICVILHRCNEFPNNTYFFQSKNPERFMEFIDAFPEGTILCTTGESNRNYPQISGGMKPFHRMLSLMSLPNIKKMVTIEPIMDFDLKYFIDTLIQIDLIQINIGADSSHNNLPEPPKEKILALISELEKFTIVHQKNNLKRLLK